jgi:hypothetical protein
MLTIASAGAGQATIFWSPASTNWVLPENLNLGTAYWVNSPGGATNPVNVPAVLPRKFYRLFEPWRGQLSRHNKKSGSQRWLPGF